MNLDDALLAVLEVLRRLDVPYMLVGSFASNAYGIPRSTHDVDFVVQVPAGTVERIVEALGPEFQLEPLVSFEMVTATTRYVVSLADSPFSVEFFLLSDDPHDRERFARRHHFELPGSVTATLPTAEDVVITKLRWFADGKRAKDRDDARGVIAVRADRLDWAYIHRWCDVHGTGELLQQIRDSIPPLP
jgi:hypothetical protein